MKIDGMSGLQGTVNHADKVAAPVQAKEVKAATPVKTDIKSADGNVVQGVESHSEVINDEMLDKAIAAANKTLVKHNNIIERSVHDVTKTVMYVMKDTETDEVIREFPPKKIQDMIAKMWELAGLFVDEKA